MSYTPDSGLYVDTHYSQPTDGAPRFAPQRLGGRHHDAFSAACALPTQQYDPRIYGAQLPPYHPGTRACLQFQPYHPGTRACLQFPPYHPGTRACDPQDYSGIHDEPPSACRVRAPPSYGTHQKVDTGAAFGTTEHVSGSGASDSLTMAENWEISVKKWLLRTTRQESTRDPNSSVPVYLVLAIDADEPTCEKFKKMQTHVKEEFMFSKILSIDRDAEHFDTTEATKTLLFNEGTPFLGPDVSKEPNVVKIKSLDHIVSDEVQEPAHGNHRGGHGQAQHGDRLRKKYHAHVLFLQKNAESHKNVLKTIFNNNSHNCLRIVISTFELNVTNQVWNRSQNDQLFFYTLNRNQHDENRTENAVIIPEDGDKGEEYDDDKASTNKGTHYDKIKTVGIKYGLLNNFYLDMPATLQELLEVRKKGATYEPVSNRRSLKNGYEKLLVRTAFSIFLGMDVLQKRDWVSTRIQNHEGEPDEDMKKENAQRCLDEMVLVYLGAGTPSPNSKRHPHLQKVAELFNIRMILYDTNDMHIETTAKMLTEGVEVRVKNEKEYDWYGKITGNIQGKTRYEVKKIQGNANETKWEEMENLQLARIEYRKKMFTTAEVDVISNELKRYKKYGVIVSDIRSGVSSAIKADEIVSDLLNSGTDKDDVENNLKALSQRLKNTMGDMAERDNIVQVEWKEAFQKKGTPMLLFSAKYFNRHAVPGQPSVGTLLPRAGFNLIEAFIPSTETNWMYINNSISKISNQETPQHTYNLWKLCKHKLLGAQVLENKPQSFSVADDIFHATSASCNCDLNSCVVHDGRYYQPIRNEIFDTDDNIAMQSSDYIFEAGNRFGNVYTRTCLIEHGTKIDECKMQKCINSDYFYEPRTRQTTLPKFVQDEGQFYRLVQDIESNNECFTENKTKTIDDALYDLHAITDPNHTQENCMMIRAMLYLCRELMPHILTNLCETANEEYNEAFHKKLDHKPSRQDPVLKRLIELEVGIVTAKATGKPDANSTAKVWAYYRDKWKGWQRAVYLNFEKKYETLTPSWTQVPGLPNKTNNTSWTPVPGLPNKTNNTPWSYQQCIHWYSTWLYLLPLTNNFNTISKQQMQEALMSCHLLRNVKGNYELNLGEKGWRSPGKWPTSKPVLYVAIEQGILAFVEIILSGSDCLDLLQTNLRRKGSVYTPLGYALYYECVHRDIPDAPISMKILHTCKEKISKGVENKSLDAVRAIIRQYNTIAQGQDKPKREELLKLAKNNHTVTEAILGIRKTLKQSTQSESTIATKPNPSKVMVRISNEEEAAAKQPARRQPARQCPAAKRAVAEKAPGEQAAGEQTAGEQTAAKKAAAEQAVPRWTDQEWWEQREKMLQNLVKRDESITNLQQIMEFYHFHALHHEEWPGKMTDEDISLNYEVPLKALLKDAPKKAADERAAAQKAADEKAAAEVKQRSKQDKVYQHFLEIFRENPNTYDEMPTWIKNRMQDEGIHAAPVVSMDSILRRPRPSGNELGAAADKMV